MIKPQPRLLSSWRQSLVAGAFIPAFLLTLFFKSRYSLWLIFMGLWLVVFLVFYTIYLPLCYKSIGFIVKDNMLIKTDGVIYMQKTIVPLLNIQFVSVVRSPISRINGIASVLVVSPGGKVIIPGLIPEEAENFASILRNECSELADE